MDVSLCVSIHTHPVFLSFRLTHVKKEIVVRLATRTRLGSGDDSRAGEWGSGRLTKSCGEDGETEDMARDTRRVSKKGREKRLFCVDMELRICERHVYLSWILQHIVG